MDLPMGLNKFPGDTRTVTDEEFEEMVKGIEGINRSLSTVFFCITPYQQINLVETTLKEHGYPETELLILHKQFKSDKKNTGGFVSAVLTCVVGYKDKGTAWGGASLPKDTIECLKWKQNLWTLYKPTPAQVDSLGDKVNSCPQDPMIVNRLVQLFNPGLVFSSGDGPGWASPECLRLGVDCIVTEPHAPTFSFLQERLLIQTGTMMYEEGRKALFWKKVWIYVNKHAKVNDSKDEKRQEIFNVVKKSSLFSGLSDQVAASVVENLAQIPNLDLSETAHVLEAAKKSIDTFKAASGGTPAGPEKVEEDGEVKEKVIDLSSIPDTSDLDSSSTSAVTEDRSGEDFKHLSQSSSSSSSSSTLSSTLSTPSMSTSSSSSISSSSSQSSTSTSTSSIITPSASTTPVATVSEKNSPALVWYKCPRIKQQQNLVLLPLLLRVPPLLHLDHWWGLPYLHLTRHLFRL